MFPPSLRYLRGIKESLRAELAVVEQVPCPLFQGPAEPRANRDGETRFRTVDEFGGHILLQHLSKNPLPLPVPNFHCRRKAPAEGRHGWVEEWHAGLETDAHAGPIDLHED